MSRRRHGGVIESRNRIVGGVVLVVSARVFMCNSQRPS